MLAKLQYKKIVHGYFQHSDDAQASKYVSK